MGTYEKCYSVPFVKLRGVGILKSQINLVVSNWSGLKGLGVRSNLDFNNWTGLNGLEVRSKFGS
jgi:hypothetical protein